MPRTKGALNKATLEKQKQAPALLEEQKKLYVKLTEESLEIETRILEDQAKAKSLQKRMRALEKEIRLLEQYASEETERVRKQTELAQIEAVVQELVGSGISSDDLILRLKKAL